MLVSVVIPTYAMERYEVFSECVESVLGQTYDPLEIVIVVDGNDDVYERVHADFGHFERMLIRNNDLNRGVSASRTIGAELASGEVVAMIDDDAVAEPDWIEELVRVYDETDAVAVGGYVAPEWIGETPAFFPEEFYWLIGCTEKGFADHREEVRNTYGSNISFRRDVFLDVGGYDENTGRKGSRHLQAHEAPVCIRIYQEYGKGVIYTDEAVVNHKMFAYRGDPWWLLKRAFWQGYSKRIMALLVPDSRGNEREFLRRVYFRYVPHRVRELVRSPSLAEFLQLIAIFGFTAAVGLGYLVALPRRDLVEAKSDEG
jgi:glycosyltransferase involved in cell wall biosynthesis